MDNTSQLLSQAYIEAYLQESERLMRLFYGGNGANPTAGPQLIPSIHCPPPSSYPNNIGLISGLTGPNCCWSMNSVEPMITPLPPTSIAGLTFASSMATPTIFETPAPTPMPNLLLTPQFTHASIEVVNVEDDEEEESTAPPTRSLVCTCRAVSKSRREEMTKFNKHLKAVMSARRRKLLPCCWCGEEVDNDMPNIRSHVYCHSTEPLYCCRLCRVGFKEQRDIFNHVIRCRVEMGARKGSTGGPSTTAFPSVEADSMCCDIEDRREMPKLIAILEGCFPRGAKRKREDYTKLVDELIKQTNALNENGLACQQCGMTVPARKISLIEHLHPPHSLTGENKAGERTATYSDNDQRYDSHSDPKISKDKDGKRSHTCTSPEILTNWFHSCFYDHYSANTTAQK